MKVLAVAPNANGSSSSNTKTLLGGFDENSREYRSFLQYKDDLNSATWTDLAPVVASGTSASSTDTSATSLARFYRVLVQ